MAPSTYTSVNGKNKLLLTHYNEAYVEKEVPCFFNGRVNHPFEVARCLIALSRIVTTSFLPTAAHLRDPIVTAGGGQLRFEAFSSCCGVYGRLDLTEEELNGDFLALGTTNVDFNTPMISALAKIKKGENITLALGEKEFTLVRADEQISEKKVKLPVRWVKGLTTVQVFSAKMKKAFSLNKVQMLQVFRSLPKGSDIKTDYFLKMRGRLPVLSPVKANGAVCVGGVHRLRLLESLLPLANRLDVYSMDEELATAWQLSIGQFRFTMILSREFWRGFSGEGAILDHLTTEIPDEWLTELDQFSQVNETFNLKESLFKFGVKEDELEDVALRLASMGLLGIDLNNQNYFYRKLPFDMTLIERLNPRYKNALKLINKGFLELIEDNEERLEAKVKGSGIYHKVLIQNGRARCTCTWFSNYQGSRGDCKHILALKIIKKHTDNQIAELMANFEL